MLNRIEWDKPKVADVFSLDSLIAWLEKQPAETAYDWYDIEGCLSCAYLRAQGVRDPSGDGLLSRVFSNHEQYHAVGRPMPWTFGAALTRARKAAQASS